MKHRALCHEFFLEKSAKIVEKEMLNLLKIASSKMPSNFPNNVQHVAVFVKVKSNHNKVQG